MRIRFSQLGALLLSATLSVPGLAALDWEASLGGAHRDQKNAARDEFRHPR